MPHRATSLLTTALVVASLMLSSCGGADEKTGSTSEHESLVPATPRGLAAGVITHLPSDSVMSIGGGDDHGGLQVLVVTSDEAVARVYLHVQQARRQLSVRPCGGDSGYRRVTCETRPAYLEVVSRKSDKGQAPTLIGRYQDQPRGELLIELWGSDTAKSRDVIRDLLRDPLLGVETSTVLNEEGKSLTEFGDLQIAIDDSSA